MIQIYKQNNKISREMSENNDLPSNCNNAFSNTQKTNNDSKDKPNQEQIIQGLSIPIDPQIKNIEIFSITINDFDQETKSQKLPPTAYSGGRTAL